MKIFIKNAMLLNVSLEKLSTLGEYFLDLINLRNLICPFYISLDFSFGSDKIWFTEPSKSQFAIEHIGMPVGSVQSLYMYTHSFVEFLMALDKTLLLDELENHSIYAPMSPLVHSLSLELLSTYMAVGGMPEAVKKWIETHNIHQYFEVHQSFINTYKHDFIKYAKKSQLEKLSAVFESIPA